MCVFRFGYDSHLTVAVVVVCIRRVVQFFIKLCILKLPLFSLHVAVVFVKCDDRSNDFQIYYCVCLSLCMTFLTQNILLCPSLCLSIF